jgi:hypothetical protein
VDFGWLIGKDTFSTNLEISSNLSWSELTMTCSCGVLAFKVEIVSPAANSWNGRMYQHLWWMSSRRNETYLVMVIVD